MHDTHSELASTQRRVSHLMMIWQRGLHKLTNQRMLEGQCHMCFPRLQSGLGKRTRCVCRCLVSSCTHVLFQLAETAAIPHVGVQRASAEHVVGCSPSFFLEKQKLTYASKFPSKNSSLLCSNFLLSARSRFPLFIVSAWSSLSQCDVDASKQLIANKH
jgi:hypothetical protein